MTDAVLFGQEPPPEPVEAAPGADPALPGVIARAAPDWPPVDAQRRHCGVAWCRCTHDNGCEFGWVDSGTASVAPCPTCQPDKIQRHDETRAQWLHRLRKARR